MTRLTRRQFLGAGALALVRGVRSEPRPVVRPEFERTFDEALFCLAGGAEDQPFFEAAFRDLVSAIPSYARLHLVARREPRGLAALERTKLHLVEDPAIEIELWAQDLGEPILLDGRERFLVSKRMSETMGPAAKMSSDRKRIAEIVFGEDSVREAPFVFEGGNLAFDSDRVLVGYNVASRTVAAYEALGSKLTRARVHRDVEAAFGLEAVEMGDEPQTPLLQHIDQAFVLLEDGAAVACRIEDGGLESETRQLRYYASQLRELGYRVFFLDHRSSDLERYRSSINAVPFRDRTTGGKRILFPVFPGELREDAKAVAREALTGKAARAFDLYRDLGYAPTPLRDLTHPLGGNTHCIVNVLS